MNIYYQGLPGAYGNKASNIVKKNFNLDDTEIIGVETFKDVFNEIDNGNIGVIPIENSYAGSIHENFYHLVGGKYEIISEIFLDINHFLLSGKNDISFIKEVYSHPQALMQCQNYLKKHNISPIVYFDTAGAAKYVSESGRNDVASISSDLCSEIYGLNILDKNIQDQKGNTTRFFVVVLKDIYIQDQNILKSNKTGKISIEFKTKDIPSALYKCLGAFATRYINLTKIESLPARKNKFEYIFWVDFQKNVDEKTIIEALDELKYFCKDLIILGDY